MSRPLRKARNLGAWLSLLAIYVQVALPMLVAVQLVTAHADRAGSAAFALCGGHHAASGADRFGATGAPASGGDHFRRCCPLCAAIGASYISPAEILLSVPTISTGAHLRVAGTVAVPNPPVATYDARAPPSGRIPI